MALSECDVGIILHKLCDLTHNTIPNKVYDYLYSGLPVISTKMKPLIRVINDFDCGLLVEENPESVAKSFMKLYNNKKIYRIYQNNTTKLFSVLDKIILSNEDKITAILT